MKLFAKFDAFAKPPTLYYRGEAFIATKCGCIVTLILSSVFLACVADDLLASIS